MTTQLVYYNIIAVVFLYCVFQIFSGYYDTMVGTKADSNSYKTIATEIGKEPDEILFLTDSADGELTL